MMRLETAGSSAARMELPLRPRRKRARVIRDLEAGPKLIELPQRALLAARASVPNTRILPVVEYEPAAGLARPSLTGAGRLAGPPPGAQNAPPTQIEVRCAKTSKPLAGLKVSAIVDPDKRLGAEGKTDAGGKVDLPLGRAPIAVETLGVEPPKHGWWGAWQTRISLSGSHRVELDPVDLELQPVDGLRYFYAALKGGNEGAGVRVGVVDTGVGTHSDLKTSGGRNFVQGEDTNDYGDNGLGHGTHVAGVIASTGRAPNGVSGLAPRAELYSYRVYGSQSRTAKNLDIFLAVAEAARDGCDVVNLSLQVTRDDEVVKEAIDRAEAAGMMAIAAAGNGNRKPVASPARYTTAVTGLGRRRTFPAGSWEERYVATPTGTDPDDFLAGFSNLGRDVGLTAPGLGVVSTLPGGYGPLSGTSMAAAAATGMAARLLSDAPHLLGMPRDRFRFMAMLNHLNAQTQPLGLGLEAEGFGILHS